jgi:hypothetical protein
MPSDSVFYTLTVALLGLLVLVAAVTALALKDALRHEKADNRLLERLLERAEGERDELRREVKVWRTRFCKERYEQVTGVKA